MTIYHKPKIYLHSILSAGLMVGLLMIIGCGGPSTKIADITKDVSHFKDKAVTVRGEVVETFTIPFVETGAYQLDDGSGKLWVIREGNIPARGTTVKVKGTVTVGVEIAGERFGTVLMETVVKN